MFSYQASECPHRGHRDGGRTMLSSFGTRAITTLRKLPIASPSKPSQPASSELIQVSTAPFSTGRPSQALRHLANNWPPAIMTEFSTQWRLLTYNLGQGV